MFCDLHTHTTASDGDLTPLQLINLAVERGLAALGVTDHDTVAGLPAAQQAAKLCGIPLAWGIELSASFQPGTLHILGYFIDISNRPLLDVCHRMQNSREIRNATMLDRLTELGMPITMKELEHQAGEDTVGRPHIAALMVKKGYVENNQQAFDQYLAKGAGVYVDRDRLQPAEAIRLIKDAGGVAVMAHPFQTRLEKTELSDFIQSLHADGLGGIETHYWNHSTENRKWLEEIAEDLGLVKTGGSDYHGPGRGDNDLGIGDGSLQVPFQFYDDLRKAAGRWL